MMPPCPKCSKASAKSFVVTDSSGNCLLTDESGACIRYRTASLAQGEARTAGLSTFQVRPG